MSRYTNGLRVVSGRDRRRADHFWRDLMGLSDGGRIISTAINDVGLASRRRDRGRSWAAMTSNLDNTGRVSAAERRQAGLFFSDLLGYSPVRAGRRERRGESAENVPLELGPLSESEWGSVLRYLTSGETGPGEPLTADPIANARRVAGAIFCSRNALRLHNEDPLLCLTPSVTEADSRVRAMVAQVTVRGPIAMWQLVPRDDRIRHVMNLLVGTHRYPVNGAAGLVGNLMSESGVLPNRTERSAGESPMRAPDFADRMRSFTPEQIMNRSPSTRQGPKWPGVGLAQWTTPQRRSGLFQHPFRGVVLGPRVLFDMDAQVDYLVRELARSYPGVDGVLRGAGVSVEAASDEVLYNFEIPGAILENRRKLPRADPRVQAVFRQRRAQAATALRVQGAGGATETREEGYPDTLALRTPECPYDAGHRPAERFDEWVDLHAESSPSGSCLAWIPTAVSGSYTDWVAAPARGRLTLLINGRNSNGAGPDIDLTEPLDEMERAVKALGRGDFCYLSAWFFEPSTALRTGAYSGHSDWGGLFAAKAQDGVEIRILINDFDPITSLDAWLRSACLVPLEALVRSLPAAARSHFKYLVTRHPAHYTSVRAAVIRRIHGGGSGPIFIGSHHQKFMVARRGGETTAFCGGLDIESRKVPSAWSYSGLIAWHDLTLKLEGPITADLERQFVERWNREQAGARNALLPDWGSFGTLTRPTSLPSGDSRSPKQAHAAQLTRTVSSDAPLAAFTTNRSDIREAYRRIIGCAREYLYLENQYFRDLSLADELASRARRVSDLRAIFVGMLSAAADDGTNPLTSHGDGLQGEFFRRVHAGFGSRMEVFTMTNRSVHAKLIVGDDRFMSIGSANANTRSFELDSELNITVDESSWVRAARLRLWAHNLGVGESIIGGWQVADFIRRWTDVVTANAALAGGSHFDRMTGEGIVRMDWHASRSRPNPLIPDYLVRLDVGPGPNLIYGPPRTTPAMDGGQRGRTAVA